MRDDARVATAQFGIFAIGTSAHVYLEFDVRPGVEPARAGARGGRPRGAPLDGRRRQPRDRRAARAVGSGQRRRGRPASAASPSRSSAPAGSPCRRPNTTCGCGSPARHTTSSSTGRRDARPRWPRGDARERDHRLVVPPRAATSPASMTAPKTRPARGGLDRRRVPAGCPGRASASCSSSSGRTTRRLEGAARHDAGARDGTDQARQRRARRRRDAARTRTCPARWSRCDGEELRHLPAQRRLRRREPTTARCSSASAASRGGWRGCCGGWPASATASATRSPGTRHRSPAPTTSCRRSRRWARSPPRRPTPLSPSEGALPADTPQSHR